MTRSHPTMSCSSSIRKAAILVRSLDSDTAAALLTQLSTPEVQQIRDAVSSLGDIDADERADVVAEFRSAGAATSENCPSGVELADSLLTADVEPGSQKNPPENAGCESPHPLFAFLDHAVAKDLAPYLAREQAQTIAVVLSYLDDQRAATLLEVLPVTRQLEVIERLAVIGTADLESLRAIEQELAAWVKKQPKQCQIDNDRTNHAARILAASNSSSRQQLLTELQKHKRQLADQLSAKIDDVHSSHQSTPQTESNITAQPVTRSQSARSTASQDVGRAAPSNQPTPREQPTAESTAKPVLEPSKAAHPAIPFENLTSLDTTTLHTIFCTVDREVLRLALASADDTLVTRITSQLPKKLARQFRHSLYELGPTRLSDVQRARRSLAATATQFLSEPSSSRFTSPT